MKLAKTQLIITMETQYKIMKYKLPQKKGKRPKTRGPMPHIQLDQLADPEIEQKLGEAIFSHQSFIERPSGYSLPGARGIYLKNGDEAKVRIPIGSGTEIGHIHPHPELGSMHLHLPEPLARELIEKGWGEFHPLVQQGAFPPNIVMLYAPRDDNEISVIQWFVEASYSYVKSEAIASFQEV